MISGSVSTEQITMARSEAGFCMNFRVISSPLSPGIESSRTAMSGRYLSIASAAELPSEAVATRSNSDASSETTVCRALGLSSAATILGLSIGLLSRSTKHEACQLQDAENASPHMKSSRYKPGFQGLPIMQ